MTFYAFVHPFQLLSFSNWVDVLHGNDPIGEGNFKNCSFPLSLLRGNDRLHCTSWVSSWSIASTEEALLSALLSAQSHCGLAAWWWGGSWKDCTWKELPEFRSLLTLIWRQLGSSEEVPGRLISTPCCYPHHTHYVLPGMPWKWCCVLLSTSYQESQDVVVPFLVMLTLIIWLRPKPNLTWQHK